MAEFSSYPPSHPCWIDLMSRDAIEAAAFYEAVFGWKTIEKDMQGMGFYALFHLDGKVVAGLGEMTANMRFDGMPGIWNSYVNTLDAEALTEQVPTLGGRVFMDPASVMDEGTIAGIEDPSAAHLFLWQPGAHIGSQLSNVPNTWVWSELATKEPEKAIEFYGQLFGWTCEKELSSPTDYWMVMNGDRRAGGILRKPEATKDSPNHWAVYFSVENLEQAVSKLETAGGEVKGDAMDTNVGTIIDVADNHGASFKLIQMSVEAD